MDFSSTKMLSIFYLSKKLRSQQVNNTDGSIRRSQHNYRKAYWRYCKFGKLHSIIKSLKCFQRSDAFVLIFQNVGNSFSLAFFSFPHLFVEFILISAFVKGQDQLEFDLLISSIFQEGQLITSFFNFKWTRFWFFVHFNLKFDQEGFSGTKLRNADAFN
jgi:hypothetical protein